MPHNDQPQMLSNRNNNLLLPRSIYNNVFPPNSQNHDRKSAQRSEFRSREFLLPRAYGDVNPSDKRKFDDELMRHHVTSQPPQPTSRVTSDNFDHYRGPRLNRDHEVTALDHCIEDHGGTTSTLDCLPHRLRITKEKKSRTMKEHMEDLTREIGYLRQELAYYKDTREVLMRFHESISDSHRVMKVALCEMSKGVAISEQRLLDYWGIHHDDGNVVDNVF